MVVLATVTKPGDAVLTESLNYAGIKAQCRPVQAGYPRRSDRAWPTAGHACYRPKNGVGAILCSPTLHNPTDAMMPLKRRREVVNIAAKLGAYIIENDSYGHLTGDKTPTIAALDPNGAGGCVIFSHSRHENFSRTV